MRPKSAAVCRHILVLMIFRSRTGIVNIRKKKSKYGFSFCNLVDFVINKTWGSATRRIFLVFTPSPVPPSVVSQLIFKIFQRKPDPYNLVEGCSCYIFTSVLVLANRGWLLGTTIESSGEAQKHHSDPCTWTSRRRKMYVKNLWSNRSGNCNCFQGRY